MNQAYDLARALKELPAAKARAAEDRTIVFTERATIPREKLPLLTAGTLSPYTKLASHPVYGSSWKLVDVQVQGGDDHHWNLVITYGYNLYGALGSASAFNSHLAKTGKTVTHPAYGSSEDIVWQLAVLDPDGNSYAQPSLGAAHPTNANALFITESTQRDGPWLNVQRHYRQVAAASEQVKHGYTVSYEDAPNSTTANRFPVVTVNLELKTSEFDPVAGAITTCPIDGSNAGSTNTSLDFKVTRTLTLAAPPSWRPIDPLRGIVSLVYRKLPGYELVDWEFNEQTGALLPVTSQHVAASSVSPESLGLQSGNIITAKRQNAIVAVKTTRSASPFATAANPSATTRSYDTFIHYYWPAVLESIDWMDWARLDGEVDTYPRLVWKRYPYSGPTKATIAETWAATMHTLPATSVMLPRGAQYSSPKFSISIPACLRPAVFFRCDIGNNDPVYSVNTGSTRVEPATNYTDWPATLLVSAQQRPFRGGWLMHTVTVTAPA